MANGFCELIQHCPKNCEPDTTLTAACCWVQMQGADLEAIHAFRTAVEIDPDHVASFFHLGLMYHKIGEHANAIDAFGEVIQRRPNDPRAYEKRGLVLQDAGDQPSALEDFSTSLGACAAGRWWCSFFRW